MKRSHRANKRTLTCEKIRQYIQENRLKEGAKLPSQREMCCLFGVSRQCIQDAVDILIREGVHYTRAKSGQYVGARPFEVDTASAISTLRRYQYPNFIILSTEVLRQRQILPDEQLQQIMKIDPGRPVMEMLRVRRKNTGLVLSVEHSYIPLDLFPDFLQIDFVHESLRSLFVDRGFEPVVRKSTICISWPDAEDARLLENAGETVASSGVVFSPAKNRVIEYYRNYCDPTSIRYIHTTNKREGG